MPGSDAKTNDVFKRMYREISPQGLAEILVRLDAMEKAGLR